MPETFELDAKYKKTRDYTRQVLEQAITDPDQPLLEWHLAVAEKDLKYLGQHLEDYGPGLPPAEQEKEAHILEELWGKLTEAQGIQAQRHRAELKESVERIKQKSRQDPGWTDKFR